MASPQWQQRRQAWLRAWTARTGRSPMCAICGASWDLSSGDLHHRSYQRLGAESDRDLIPLCRRPCHDRLHEILEAHPAWLRLGREAATDVIIARLRTRNDDR